MKFEVLIPGASEVALSWPSNRTGTIKEWSGERFAGPPTGRPLLSMMLFTSYLRHAAFYLSILVETDRQRQR